MAHQIQDLQEQVEEVYLALNEGEIMLEPCNRHVPNTIILFSLYLLRQTEELQPHNIGTSVSELTEGEGQR